MNKRKGFTLIELLVVIAIIAVLLSVLMPAMRRVREQGKLINCVATLRQWGLTFAIYAEENEGVFPSGDPPNGFWWIVQLEPRVQSWKQNPLWFCPSSKEPIQDEFGNQVPTFNIFNAWGIYYDGRLSPDGIAGSYGINGYVLNTDPGATFEGGRQTANNWRTPRVSGANNIPLFIEALRFDLWPLETDAPAQYEFEAWSSNNHMARCCINRHQGFLNSTFCDFSARRVGLKELYTLKWHKQFNVAGPWTTAGGVTADDWPEWLRPFKEY